MVRSWESPMARNKNKDSYRGFREFYDSYDEEIPKKKKLAEKKGRARSKINEKLQHIDINNINDEDFDDLEDY